MVIHRGTFVIKENEVDQRVLAFQKIREAIVWTKELVRSFLFILLKYYPLPVGLGLLTTIIFYILHSIHILYNILVFHFINPFHQFSLFCSLFLFLQFFLKLSHRSHLHLIISVAFIRVEQ